MSNVVRLSAQVVQSFLSSRSNVSSAIAATAVVAQPVFIPLYRGWRVLRLINLYKNPANCVSLMAGHGINAVVGDHTLIKTSAICLHIIAQMMSCAELWRDMEREFRIIKKARYSYFMAESPVVWQTRSEINLIPVSYSIKIMRSGKNLLVRTHIVALAILRIGKRFFLLIMNITYLADLFFLSSNIGNESVNELFTNIDYIVDNLSTRKNYIIKKLRANRSCLNEILKKSNSKLTADDIIDVAQKRLNNEENKDNGEQTGPLFYLTLCLDKWRWEFLHDLGLEKLAPKPDKKIMSWVERQNRTDGSTRYPKRTMITKPAPAEKLITKFSLLLSDKLNSTETSLPPPPYPFNAKIDKKLQQEYDIEHVNQRYPQEIYRLL